jgi:hypothetical protein
MIFKEPPRFIAIGHLRKHLTDLFTWLKELANGLVRLNFTENFESFKITIKIFAGEEVGIPNEFARLPSGGIPTGYIIIRAIGGNDVVDGNTPWSGSTVYLQNVGSNDSTVTVIFFK